ncbi:hypothetical protein EVAR_2742_1 [Eumeta japonica]|uniref:Uncharacterized protein n=1 Tax=Eumeta variegata TaxID=151549 RepID=A0A4C1T239_EUMVA|nr:hypothetical protein EVAR_2742_1 [Eumeta japonica]
MTARALESSRPQQPQKKSSYQNTIANGARTSLELNSNFRGYGQETRIGTDSGVGIKTENRTEIRVATKVPRTKECLNKNHQLGAMRGRGRLSDAYHSVHPLRF